MISCCIVFITFAFVQTHVSADYPGSLDSQYTEYGQYAQYYDFHQLFEAAKRSYLDGDYQSCAEFVLRGLEDFSAFSSRVAHCHHYCGRPTPRIDDVLTRGRCMRFCKEEDKSRKVNSSHIEEYVDRKPYEFLHVCAYKVGNLTLAASSAYTFFLLHNTDDIMLNNIHFYRRQPGVSVSHFVNLEESQYVSWYITGAMSYSDQVWVDTITDMEMAVGLFYSDFNRCEALCEEKASLDPSLGFHEALANRFLAVMRCSEMCFTRLTEVRGKIIPDVLSDMYNYLQFAYFKVGRLHDALQCADTFLVFVPTDPDMLHNRKYYLTLGAVSVAPRQEAVWFRGHMTELSATLARADDQYHDTDQFQIPSDLTDKRTYHSDLLRRESESETCSSDTCPGAVKFVDIDVKGKRFLAEDVISERNLDDLLTIQKQFSLKRAISPVMLNLEEENGDRSVVAEESIYDLSMDRVVMLHRIEKFPLASLRFVLSVVETLKKLVDEHLKPDITTYIKDVRFVRIQIKTDNTSIPMGPPAPPCNRQESGLCHPGANQNQSFLVLLHLNDLKKGGELVLKNSLDTSESVYPPRRGQVVSFSTENYQHQVSAVKPGDRYSLYISLTNVSSKQSVSHAQAVVLSRYPARPRHSDLTGDGNQSETMDGNQPMNGDGKQPMRTESVKEMEKEGVTVRDLGRRDRMLLDGLADQSQCLTLMELAKEAQKNDGYRKGKELGQVHTDHELFSGLTIDNAAKLAEKSLVNVESVLLYQKLSELGKDMVHKYFQLRTPLYFDYTHLVCRTAKNDSNKAREDLSHPVHSDNCIIYSDGSCKKESPAYTERDYSAILYLNDDFEGGEFLFTSKKPVGINKWHVEAEVSPQCGRLVAFRADDYHGVRAVLSGRRCALALWFTLDPYYREKAHIEAKRILKKLKP